MALCPKGRVRRVLGLVCGAVMTVALVSPVVRFDMAAYSSAMSKYRDEALLSAEDARESGDVLMRSIIERECAAYILDKAESLGMEDASAAVTLRWKSEGCWVPDSVTLSGVGADSARGELGEAIAMELGVPPERQYWEAG